MKKALFIALCFITLTVIGTLTHETGHIIPAKLLGHKTTLHYGSMNWQNGYLDYSNALHAQYGDIANIPKRERSKLDGLRSKHRMDTLLISLGGPIQTLSTGILGLIILYRRRRLLGKIPFGFTNWIAVFLALFWSRPVFNLLTGLASYILGHADIMFGGDEAKICKLLNLPVGTIGISTGLVGMLICTIIVFKVVPVKVRSTFIVAGIIGSGIGYMMWFRWIGPIILP